MRSYAGERLRGREAGEGAWELSPGAVAYARRGRRSGLVYAPGVALARRLAALTATPGGG